MDRLSRSQSPETNSQHLLRRHPQSPPPPSNNDGNARPNDSDNPLTGRPETRKGFYQFVKTKFTGRTRDVAESSASNLQLVVPLRSDRLEDANRSSQNREGSRNHSDDDDDDAHRSSLLMGQKPSAAQDLREVCSRVNPREIRRYAGIWAERRLSRKLERQARLTERRMQLEVDAIESVPYCLGLDDGDRCCVICLESFDTNMVRLYCSHWYCLTDLANGFRSALESRQLFMCCEIDVPTGYARKSGILSEQVLQSINLLVQERTTKDPIYCSNAHCASFIPAIFVFGLPFVKCMKCEAKICKYCRKVAHGTSKCVFEPDQEVQLLRRMGYKECPWCHAIVSKTEGCNTIRCHCGMYFCYKCETEHPCLCL